MGSINRRKGTKWREIRSPLYVIVLVLLVANTSKGARLLSDSINYEGSIGHAAQGALATRSRQSNLASDEKPIAENCVRSNSFVKAIFCSFHSPNILKSRDGIPSSCLLPTTVNKECGNKTLSIDFEDCKRKVQFRNGKFAVLTSLVGIAFLFILGFTISGHLRREKARRQTSLHVAAGDMSQQTSGIIVPALNRPIENDPEVGNGATADVLTDDQTMRGEETGQRTNHHMMPATFDGANDGWGAWLRENRKKLQGIPRTVPSLPRDSPAPRIPILRLPTPTFGSIRQVFYGYDFGTLRGELQGEHSKVKGPSKLRWGSTV